MTTSGLTLVLHHPLSIHSIIPLWETFFYSHIDFFLLLLRRLLTSFFSGQLLPIHPILLSIGNNESVAVHLQPSLCQHYYYDILPVTSSRQNPPTTKKPPIFGRQQQLLFSYSLLIYVENQRPFQLHTCILFNKVINLSLFGCAQDSFLSNCCIYLPVQDPWWLQTPK